MMIIVMMMVLLLMMTTTTMMMMLTLMFAMCCMSSIRVFLLHRVLSFEGNYRWFLIFQLCERGLSYFSDRVKGGGSLFWDKSSPTTLPL